MIASHKLSISLIESIGAHPSIKINDYMSLDEIGEDFYLQIKSPNA